VIHSLNIKVTRRIRETTILKADYNFVDKSGLNLLDNGSYCYEYDQFLVLRISVS